MYKEISEATTQVETIHILDIFRFYWILVRVFNYYNGKPDIRHVGKWLIKLYHDMRGISQYIVKSAK